MGEGMRRRPSSPFVCHWLSRARGKRELKENSCCGPMNAAIDPITRCSRGRCALIPARRVGLPVRATVFSNSAQQASNSGLVGQPRWAYSYQGSLVGHRGNVG